MQRTHHTQSMGRYRKVAASTVRALYIYSCDQGGVISEDEDQLHPVRGSESVLGERRRRIFDPNKFLLIFAAWEILMLYLQVGLLGMLLSDSECTWPISRFLEVLLRSESSVLQAPPAGQSLSRDRSQFIG